MARFNEILVARFSKSLQKLFGVKGGTPVPVLGSELTPVFSIFNGVENRFLEGWNRFAAVGTPGVPGAGNRAAVRFRNPANSGVLAVLEKITIFEQTATDLAFINFDTIAAAMPTENGTSQARNLDTRQNPPPGLTGAASIVSTSVNFGAIGTSGYAAFVALNGNYDFIQTDDQEIALSPNQEITVIANSLVTNLGAAFVWRERPLEDSEKF